MNIKRIITIGIMVAIAGLAVAEPTVTDVVAKQRYPWNGLVDITCKVTGVNEPTTSSRKCFPTRRSWQSALPMQRGKLK